jgi:hypothetical protein
MASRHEEIVSEKLVNEGTHCVCVTNSRIQDMEEELVLRVRGELMQSILVRHRCHPRTGMANTHHAMVSR